MRPHYHYAPASNWLSDPNGLVWDNGRWHMFYQYNPQGELWGHMAWGHAVSDDLALWRECPPALLEDDAHMIFSGSAVIDHADSAGFGAGAMVAIYTGAAQAPARHQSQCLAFSKDGGDSWLKFDGNPVLDRAMADFRDPNVFWHEPSARWIMVVVLSEENAALIYGSANLVDWQMLSAIPTHGAAGHLWECPTLIDLPVEGSDARRWMFKVDVMSGAQGSGAIALIGDFDGVNFTPDVDADSVPQWLGIDSGRDFYAAIPWHAPRDEQGRPCWIGWMGNHAYQASLPMRGWRGAMSVPRYLSLRRGADGWQLVQSAAPTVAALFVEDGNVTAQHHQRRIAVASRLSVEGAGDWTISLQDDHGETLSLCRSASKLTISRSGGFDAAFDAPVTVAAVGKGPLCLWLDATTIEIECENGAHWAGLQHCLTSDHVDCAITASEPLAISFSTMRPPASAA